MRYTLLLAVPLLTAVSTALDTDDKINTEKINDDELNKENDAINDLLGVRPDLTNDLMQSDTGQMECISACRDTDQSCRARCLGVPGVASRKVPRKQDIDGNLPLNWRKTEASGAAAARLLPHVAAIGGVSLACLI